MPLLQVQNVGTAPIIITDPSGYTSFLMEIPPSQTKTADVSMNTLEYLAPLLRAMEGENPASSVVKLRWNIINSDTLDDRAMNEGLAGLPDLRELRLAGYAPGTAVADAVATGTGLLGNQVVATGSISNAAGTAVIALAATVPGAAGNAVTFRIATPAGGSTVVAVISNAITVTPIAGGDTAANIIGVVNADAAAKLLVQATVTTGGNFTAAVAAQQLTGGKGPGVGLTLAGTTCPLTAVSDTQLTFNIPSGISANGRIVPLEYRCGPHVSRVSVAVNTAGSTPVGTAYTNVTRPNPATLSAGTMIFNTDDNAPNWSNGTIWVDASGTPT